MAGSARYRFAGLISLMMMMMMMMITMVVMNQSVGGWWMDGRMVSGLPGRGRNLRQSGGEAWRGVQKPPNRTATKV